MPSEVVHPGASYRKVGPGWSRFYGKTRSRNWATTASMY